MTKRQEEPIGEAGIKAIRRIAQEGYGNVNGLFVDTYTASAIVAVYDALNDENKAKLLALPILRVAAVCFKLIK